MIDSFVIISIFILMLFESRSCQEFAIFDVIYIQRDNAVDFSLGTHTEAQLTFINGKLT